jgi:prevent-host-death family protein
MNSFTASMAKNKFGELLDKARRAPVIIEKHARPNAVLMAYEEYQYLKGLEEKLLADGADAVVAKNEWLGVKESEKLLDDILNDET